MKHFGGKILFTFYVVAASIRLLMFNVDSWTFLDVLSELTDHRSVGLRPVEDDPNLHPNPNPRYRSAKLCTPTTPRTPMSSASMPTMSSTSSKKVNSGSRRRLFTPFFREAEVSSCAVVSAQMRQAGGRAAFVENRDSSPTTT